MAVARAEAMNTSELMMCAKAIPQVPPVPGPLPPGVGTPGPLPSGVERSMAAV